ncbi:hypothetical protein QMTAC487_11330 [Sphaerotilus sp. FB-3]|nr:hypothetical protein QMTAC487_11330 [Sphaerotilus sp. FB-3]
MSAHISTLAAAAVRELPRAGRLTASASDRPRPAYPVLMDTEYAAPADRATIFTPCSLSGPRVPADPRRRFISSSLPPFFPFGRCTASLLSGRAELLGLSFAAGRA